MSIDFYFDSDLKSCSISTLGARPASSLFPTAEKADVGATVLLVSGCQDNQLSLDGFSNGLFTENLLAVWADGGWSGGGCSRA